MRQNNLDQGQGDIVDIKAIIKHFDVKDQHLGSPLIGSQNKMRPSLDYNTLTEKPHIYNSNCYIIEIYLVYIPSYNRSLPVVAG